MTMTIRREMALAGLLAVALLAFGFAAGDAGAKGKYKTATFKAEVKGVQTYTDKYDHASTDRCDPEIHRLTKETMRFASTKPVTLTATHIPGVKNGELVFTSGSKQLSFPTKATVKRSNSNSVGHVPLDCGDNGGGVPPGPGPDCGTRVVKPYRVGVDYWKPGHIELQPEDNGGSDLFERCGSGRFPYLLSGEHFGKRQSADLPENEVFNEKYGQIITIGKGNEAIVYPDGYTETKIRWEIDLKRKKG
jgi:hypothetical protein